jgi:hypothetical protein
MENAGKAVVSGKKLCYNKMKILRNRLHGFKRYGKAVFL